MRWSLAGVDPPTVDPVPGVHPALAWRLDLIQPHLALRCGDHQADFTLGGQHRPGRGGGPTAGLCRRAEELHCLTFQLRPGAGNRVHAPDVPLHLLCGPRPVDPGRSPVDLGRERRQLVVLRHLGKALGGQKRERLHERLRAELRKPYRQFGSGLSGQDGLHDRVEHWTGVHGLHHAHDRHAGFFVAPCDGPVDGRGAAQRGQQGGMHVDGPQRGEIQDFRAEDVTVGHHHRQVRGQFPQRRHELLPPGALRRQHPELEGLGDLLHG
jgi:hypothetical protein